MGLSPDMKGFLGEKETLSVLKQLKQRGILFLHDVVVPRTNTVTQIDFMLFSTKVFMCLEVKSWGGEVFIPVANEKWKTVYGHQTIPVHNPLSQNEVHVRAANENSLHGIPYENYVVFPKNPVIHNKKPNTGTLSDLVSYVVELPDKYPEEFVQKEYEHFKELTDIYYPAFLEKEFSRQLMSSIKKTDLFGGDYD